MTDDPKALFRREVLAKTPMVITDDAYANLRVLLRGQP
jgi:hypothetical protein